MSLLSIVSDELWGCGLLQGETLDWEGACGVTAVSSTLTPCSRGTSPASHRGMVSCPGGVRAPCWLLCQVPAPWKG